MGIPFWIILGPVSSPRINRDHHQPLVNGSYLLLERPAKERPVGW